MTRYYIDANSGDEKTEQTVVGQIQWATVQKIEFSRQFRQYVSPAPPPPRWVFEFDHIRGLNGAYGD